MADEFVGHKTFDDGHGGFRHEPLTKTEADAIWASCEAAKAKREADMPTEQDAARVMCEAFHRLKELGWKDPQYGPHKDGAESRLIEAGSSGIHIGYYHAVNGQHVWWIGAEGYPSNPVLIKAMDAPK